MPALTVPQIRETIGADTLGFLSLDGLIAATERDRRELCTGCFTGKYPPGIDEQLRSVVRPVEGVLADPAMRG